MERETAMKILKELHDNSLFSNRIALETLIPELADSNDERIRKALLEMVHDTTGDELWVDYNVHKEEALAWLEKQGTPQDKGEISDGYHTFNELYYYRMLYNAAFFNMLPKEWVHKSKRHNDGEECFGGGWFIVMANLPTGQISNHYELKDWDLFQIPEKEVADKWDGHTPQEAADRLHKYLLEKQSEQKTAVTDFNAKDWYVSKVDGKIRNIYYSVDKVEPKFKVKYAGSEYNVLEVKDIAGVTFYGIEDEPNHIDYVKAENCDSGYAIKENCSPYPTKPAVFSEKKPTAWSDEDDYNLQCMIAKVTYDIQKGNVGRNNELIDWLKSLKDRVQPQPKQEWGEKDEEMAEDLIKGCVSAEKAYHFLHTPKKVSDWLKSLKDRIICKNTI